MNPTMTRLIEIVAGGVVIATFWHSCNSTPDIALAKANFVDERMNRFAEDFQIERTMSIDHYKELLLQNKVISEKVSHVEGQLDILIQRK